MKNILLVMGAATIVAAAVFTMGNLTDHVVFTVLVPGVVFGLILIGIAMSIAKNGWRWLG